MRLVTLDLDGTLLPGTTAFEVILRANGRGDDVAASDERFFAGEQSLEATFWEQWAWIQTLSLADMHRALRQGPWLEGINEGVHMLQDAGLKVRLLTDQPSTVTDFLGRWGLESTCSPVKVLEGEQIEIDARFDKWQNLQGTLAALAVEPADVCHVGNGANDVPVWNHVGCGVAVFADDVAHEATLNLGRPASFLEVAEAILAQRGGK